MSISVIVLLEGNAEIFSPVCNSEIEAIEDSGYFLKSMMWFRVFMYGW